MRRIPKLDVAPKLAAWPQTGADGSARTAQREPRTFADGAQKIELGFRSIAHAMIFHFLLQKYGESGEMLKSLFLLKRKQHFRGPGSAQNGPQETLGRPK